MGPSIHRRIEDELLADVRPVRRLWSPHRRLALWLLLIAGMLAERSVAGLRPDLITQLVSPLYLLEVAALALAASLAAAMALSAAVPGQEPTRRSVALLLGFIAVAAVLLCRIAVSTDLTVASFIDTGLGCALLTTELALIPWITLLWALRRGAPLASAAGGALVGAAGFLMAFTLMRLVCPLDELLHLLTWHGGPVLLGVVISTALGRVWLPRWRRGR
jgi:hypothetical protein